MIHCNPLIPVKRVETRIKMAAPCERLSEQLFAENDGKWVSSQISTLMKCQNYQQYQMMLNALKERPRQYGVTDGMTMRQAIDTLKPRYAQSTNEVLQFGEYLINNHFDGLDSAYREALKLDKVEKPAVEKPAESVPSE